MTNHRKISVVVASRANYGRIKSVLHAINDHPQLSLDLILAASSLLYRFGDITDTVNSDGFNISHKIYSVVEGETHSTMVKSTSLLMSELATYFSQSNPDFVLTVADRHETMATAIAASYSNIPLAHTQGGEQTGSIDDKVRHAITKLSNLHFVATEKSRQNLICMGEDPSFVYNTGCPALDLISSTNLSSSSIQQPTKGAGININFSNPYSLVVYHPVTDNIDESIPVVQSLIDFISQQSIPHIWLWPNVDAGSDQISKLLRRSREQNYDFSQLVRFVRTYNPEDYLRVLSSASYVLGNSSSFIRECSLLAIPSLIIGERQRSRELGPNARELSANGISVNLLSQAVLNLPRKENIKSSSLYSHCNAGQMIANLLATTDVDVRKPPLNFPLNN